MSLMQMARGPKRLIQRVSAETDLCAQRRGGTGRGRPKISIIWGSLCTPSDQVSDISRVLKEIENSVISINWVVEPEGGSNCDALGDASGNHRY
jgi:hypothetical protein